MHLTFGDSGVTAFWEPEGLVTVLFRRTNAHAWLKPSALHPSLKVWDGRFKDSTQGPFARMDAPAFNELVHSLTGLYGPADRFTLPEEK